MPFDGSGNYTPAAAPNFPAVGGASISSTYYNAVINDLATAMSLMITRDGQGKPSADIDWNAQDLTNVAALAAVSLAISGNATVGGTLGVTGALTAASCTVADEVYGAGWAADLSTPTKNATYNKIEAVVALIASSVAGLLDLKGDTDCSANPNYAAASKGDAYYVTVAGKIGGASGKTVEIGDMYVAKADNAGGTEAAVGTSWFVLEHSLTGALVASNNLSDVGNAATARTNLGAQASSALLTAYAAAPWTAGNQIPVLTAANTVSLLTVGASAGNILDKAAGDSLYAPKLNEQTVASAATVTPTFANDFVTITAQAAALALANPTGSAVDGWGIVIRIKDNGTARAITFDTQYRAIGVTLPTTTVISKTLYISMIFNDADTKWDVVAVQREA